MPQLRLERGVAVGEAGKLKPGPGRTAQEVASNQLGRIHAALIDLVAESGYSAVTLRDLTCRAGISSRSFYAHYPSKQECFLVVHRLLAMKALGRLSEAQAEARDDREAIHLAVTRLVRSWGLTPGEANLLLLAPYGAGGGALEVLWKFELLFQTRLERSTLSGGNESSTSAFIARAIIDGLFSVGCAQLLEDEGSKLASQAGQLAEWASSLVDPALSRLESLSEDRSSDRHSGHEFPPANSLSAAESFEPGSDLALLRAAVTKLMTRGCDTMPTPSEIAAMAGLPCSSFHANFKDVESCVTSVLDSRVEGVMQSIRHATREVDTPAGRVYRAVDSLCAQMARDSALSSLCSADVVSTMVMTKLRLQNLFAAGLGYPVFEGGSDETKLYAQASSGALCGALRRHLAGHPAEGVQELTAHLSYLMLAPAIGGREAIDVVEQEQVFSVA